MEGILQENGHRYFDKGGVEYYSVSRILEHFGISEMDKVRRIQGDAKMDRAADFGKELHRTTVMDDQDRLETCDPEIEPYLIGWRQYVADAKPRFISYEQSLVSPIWGLAGTPDRVEGVGKWLNIVDIKTGVKTVAEEIQTAMYAILVEEHFKLPVKDRYSIHVKPYGYEKVPHKSKNDLVIAKALLTVYGYKLRRGLVCQTKSN